MFCIGGPPCYDNIAVSNSVQNGPFSCEVGKGTQCVDMDAKKQTELNTRCYEMATTCASVSNVCVVQKKKWVYYTPLKDTLPCPPEG